MKPSSRAPRRSASKTSDGLDGFIVNDELSDADSDADAQRRGKRKSPAKKKRKGAEEEEDDDFEPTRQSKKSSKHKSGRSGGRETEDELAVEGGGVSRGLDSDDEREKSEAGVLSSILLVGPPGSAKTASVFALSVELRWAVLELNSAMRRGAKHIAALCGEATQSHRIQLATASDPDALSAMRAAAFISSANAPLFSSSAAAPTSKRRKRVVEEVEEEEAPSKPVGIAAFFGGGASKVCGHSCPSFLWFHL